MVGINSDTDELQRLRLLQIRVLLLMKALVGWRTMSLERAGQEAC